MRDGNTIADAARSLVFATNQQLLQQRAIDGVGHPREMSDGAQRLPTIAPRQLIVNAAARKSRAHARQRAVARVNKQMRRQAAPLGRSPFLKLHTIEAVLLVEPMSGQGSLSRPSVDGILGFAQQSSDITRTQIHTGAPLAQTARILVLL